MYDEQTVRPSLLAYDEKVSGLVLETSSKWQFIWLCGLILSFCYELPILVLTTMDRANPRLFDFVFIVGIFTVLPNLKRSVPAPKLFRIWGWIIAVFTVCAILWTPMFPWVEGKYGLMELFQYIEGLVALYMVAKIRLTSRQKKMIHCLMVVGGVVVAVYAIPEYITGTSARRVFLEQEGKAIAVGKGYLLSCLGTAYYHVSMFSALSSVMAFALFDSAKTAIGKLFSIVLGFFLAWPAFFSGARVGFGVCLITWAVFFLLTKASLKVTLVIVILIAVVFAFMVLPEVLSLEFLTERSVTFQRIQKYEEAEIGDTFRERLSLAFYNLQLYKWQGWRIPFIGAGFGVAPHTYPDGTRVYRIGAGIHNGYLWPLEQGGIAAFVLFMVFLVTCWKSLKYAAFSPSKVDRVFSLGMRSFFIGMLGGMFPGQIFWRGFGSVNFNTYLIASFLIAGQLTFSTQDDDAKSGDEELSPA